MLSLRPLSSAEVIHVQTLHAFVQEKIGQQEQLLHHLTHMDPHIAALIFRTAGGRPDFVYLIHTTLELEVSTTLIRF